MATQAIVPPRADQPRMGTEQLKRGEMPSGLTYRQTGVKNNTGRSQRDYSRRG
jgi:hypothetical protein